MDLRAPKHFQNSSHFPPTRKESPLEDDPSFYCTRKGNPFGDSFTDPLCKLNLKETSDFVKAFPLTTKSESRGLVQGSAQRRREGMSSLGVGQRRSLDAPTTPGRPVFSFSAGNVSRKCIPSKWDDAEKWLISSSCHESPAHATKPSEPARFSNQADGFHQKAEAFAEKLRVTEEKVVSRATAPSFDGPVVSLDPSLAFHGVPSEVLLKDRFTDNVEPVFPNLGYSEPTKEGFMFRHSYCEPMKDGKTEVATELQRRDIGTEMTPLGSSTTSRCHTPIKSSSPARHNTPANRSGPLVASNPSIDISELKDCHFAKLELSAQYDSIVSNWSSREEEEKEVSKSLRHCEISGERRSVAESRALAWEDEEKTKSCIRYQREEAKIQAWVNLQSAKAEAQSRKLEVKIQKMRSNLEEKLMKRMAIVHRKAEEWRAAAQLQHTQQILRASQQAEKMRSQHSSSLTDHTSCGCFSCNSGEL